MLNRKQGFTLMELVIVLAALSIIASATMPKLSQKYEQLKIEKVAEEITTIQDAARSFFTDIGYWPSSIQVLKDTGYLPSTWNETNPWGQSYTVSDTGTSFTVQTSVPDKYREALQNYTPYFELGTCNGGYCENRSSVPVPGLASAGGNAVPVLSDGSVEMTGNLKTPGIQLYDSNHLWALIRNIGNAIAFSFYDAFGNPYDVLTVNNQGNMQVAGDITADNINAQTGVYAPIYYDSDDNGYYLDPNQTSVLYDITANDATFNNIDANQINSDLAYIGRIYDSDNSSYYIDPDQTSVLNSLNLTSLNGGTPIHSGNISSYAVTSVTAGSGLAGGGGPGGITISHADTSSQGSVNNSGGVVIQDITLDGFGHVTGLGSINLDSRYYTESEADSRFVNVTGDTMTGNLTVPAIYDRDNTSYYLNPASTSILNDVRANIATLSSIRFRNNEPYSWGNQGVREGWLAYDLSGGLWFNPGYGAWGSYPGQSWYRILDTGNTRWGDHLTINVGGDATPIVINVENDWNGQDLYNINNLTASIFYDRDNTSYYLDPSSTGTSLNIAGNIQLYDKNIYDVNTLQVNEILDPEDSQVYINDNLRVNGNLEVPTSFDIRRNDTLSKLVHIETSKTADNTVEGYASVRDIYIRDSGKWASELGGMTQAEADARYVNVSGDSMSGNLTLPNAYFTSVGRWASQFAVRGSTPIYICPDLEWRYLCPNTTCVGQLTTRTTCREYYGTCYKYWTKSCSFSGYLAN